MTKIIERRLLIRTLCNAYFELKDITSHKTIYSGSLLNLGVGGMLIPKPEDESTVPLEQPFQVMVWVETVRSYPLVVNGTVLRSQEGTLAVKFQDIDNNVKKIISKMVKAVSYFNNLADKQEAV